MPRDFLTIVECAERLGLSPQRTYALAALGALPTVRHGGRLRVPMRAWEAWLAEQAASAMQNVAQPRERETQATR